MKKICGLPAKTTRPKLSKPARPDSAKAENAKAEKRVPYGHRAIELGDFPEIQGAASAIAIVVKDFQNTATCAIRQVMMIHEYSKAAKAHIRREDAFSKPGQLLAAQAFIDLFHKNIAKLSKGRRGKAKAREAQNREDAQDEDAEGQPKKPANILPKIKSKNDALLGLLLDPPAPTGLEVLPGRAPGRQAPRVR